MTRRIGIVGGTFDPPHAGHLAVAAVAASSCDLDSVLLVPTGHSWHKDGLRISDPTHRCNMTRLAAVGAVGLGVSDVDVQRRTATYTVETLAEIQALNPDADLVFCCGADAFAALDTWRDPRRIAELAELAVVTRPGTPRPEIPAWLRGRATVLDTLLVDVSSTQMRARLAAGQPCWGLLAPDVASYATSHCLYVTAQEVIPA